MPCLILVYLSKMSKENLTYRNAQSPLVINIAKWIIAIFLFVGLLHNFIANDRPIIASYDGSLSSPIVNKLLSEIGMMQEKKYEDSKYGWKVMPPIPYASDELNSKINVNVGPFDNQEIESIRYRHWLGTDQLGRDVAAGLVHGTNIAMKVGLIAVFFSLLIGLYIGLLSGYFGDDGWQSSITQLVIGAIIKLLGLYYLIYPIVLDPSWVYYSLVIALVAVLLFCLLRFGSIFPGKNIKIPIDLISTKIIEILKSIPALFIILALLAIFSTPSIWNVILIISLIGWPKFARLVRAEILQIKNLEYIQSAKSIGLSDVEIILRHALPNALTSVISITAFAISAAILLESTLSFLGLGIPIGQVSWGSMLADARANFTSWWLAVFPGLAIFVVLMAFNVLGNSLNERMNVR